MQPWGLTGESAVATERTFLSVTGLKEHGWESKVETVGEVRGWLQ